MLVADFELSMCLLSWDIITGLILELVEACHALLNARCSVWIPACSQQLTAKTALITIIDVSQSKQEAGEWIWNGILDLYSQCRDHSSLQPLE